MVNSFDNLNELLEQRRIIRQQSNAPSGFNVSPRLSTTTEDISTDSGGGLGGFFGAIGRGFEAIDRPLSDRLGLSIPEMRGPLDEIGNFLLQEATRPTNLAIAAGGAGVAGRLATSGSRAARGLGAVIQPISASSSLPARLAAETAVSAGGRAGSEAATSLLPEDAGPIPTAISGIVGGLLGAGGIATTVRSFARNGTKDIPRLTVEGITEQSLLPPPMAKQVLGARPVTLGTTDIEELRSAIRSGVTGAAPIDQIAMPVLREQENILRNASNIAAVESSRLGAVVKNAFDLEDGVITTIGGTRTTISDIAAKYPLFEPLLTPQQRTAMRNLQEALEPYKATLLESGADVGTRPDVMDGGFYIPRGNALEEGADVPKRYGRSRGGKISSEKEAVFDSQIEGITEGYEYAPFDTVISGYINDVGRKTSEMISANYFKYITNADGEKIAKTAADLFSPAIRQRAQSIRNKIRSRRAAVIRTKSVEGVQTRNAGAAGTRAQKGAARLTAAGERIPDFDPADLAQARAAREEVITEAIRLSSETRHSASIIRKAGKELTAEERNIMKLMDEIDNLSQRIQNIDNTTGQIRARALEATSEPRNLKDAKLRIQGVRELDKQSIQLERLKGTLEKKLTRAQDKVEALNLRADEAIAKGEVLEDLTLVAREERVATRQAERLMYRAERDFAVSEREFRALEREHNRLLRTAKQFEGKAEGARAAREAAEMKFDDIRDEWRDFSRTYKAAKARAQEVPPGYARITMRGLEQYSFPEPIANYVNDWLARQGPATGKKKAVNDVMENFNNLYRSIRATFDLSGSGIQTILGGYRNPKAWMKANGIMLRSLGDEKALGNFLQDFDARALADGRLTSRQLAQRGLHFSTGADEFIVGGNKIADRILKTPGIKQSNRAFGSVGDAMRTLWIDSEIQSQLARGRNMDDLLRSGDVDKLISSINKMTGHSTQQFGGSFGDVVLFAPRYLQSRLDTIAMGARGLLPGAAVDERLALRSLAQMIGIGVGLTAAYNEFFGDEDFDWLSPTRNDGNYNSNFMRVRALGHDFSMFGPWDSMLRAMMNVTSGDPQDAIRSMASGTVSIGWDLLSGESFMGDRTRDNPEQLLTTLANTVVPFSASGILANGRSIAEGNVVEGLSGQIADSLGVKATPLTPFEQLDNAAREMHGRPWVELSGQEREEVRAKYPNIAEKRDEQVLKNAERGVPTAVLTVERERIDGERINDERLQMEALSSNLISIKQFSEAIDNSQRDAALRKRELEKFLGVEYDQTIPENRALSAWYDTFTRAEIAPNVTDYDLQAQLEAELYNDIASGKYGDPARARELIDERSRPSHDPSVAWYYDNKSVINESEYYDQNDKAFERLGKSASRLGINTYSELVRFIDAAQAQGNVREALIASAILKRVEREASRQKEILRRRNPDLDRALVENKGLVPIRQRRR